MVRAKKKQKRLDAIVDRPSLPPSPSASPSPSPSPDAVRRSSRVRRAPVVLDSSPVPSSRKKRPRIDESFPSPITPNSSGSSSRRTEEVRVRKAISFNPVFRDGEGVNLRPRGRPKRKRKKKKKSKFGLKRKSSDYGSIEVSPVVDQAEVSVVEGEEGSSKNEKSLAELNIIQEEVNEEDSEEEEVLEVQEMIETENPVTKEEISEPTEDQDPIPVQPTETVVSCEKSGEKSGEKSDEKSDEKLICGNENELRENKDERRKLEIKEGRRCGLCGGGTDGRPPKVLVRDLNAPHESDKEAYEGLSGSEETNYDVWDGFGDEPGWLGRLLGPIRDQYGISRIWVHQNCAVWSPEV